MFGGGRDIGGTNDVFTFHSTSRGSDLRLGGGDFRIRVDGLEPNTAWTKAGLGIMLDDVVAAACTLMTIAVWKFI